MPTEHAPPDGIRTLLDRVRAAQLPAPRKRRAIRQRAGLSLRDVAKALDVSAATVARWEDGQEPTQAHAIAYRQLLEGLDGAVA